MKMLVAMLFFSGVIFWGRADAAIYRYLDDAGQERYTNDLSSVPPDKLGQVTEQTETESKDIPAPPPQTYSRPSAPQQDASVETRKREEQQRQKRKALEAEYQALLKEKEALDSDKSFQKRRNKDKYRNRPYILELEAKEAGIKKRISELEKELSTLPAK